MPFQVTSQSAAQALHVSHAIPQSHNSLSPAWINTQIQSEIGISVDALRVWIEEYLKDCELRLLSRDTLEGRKYFYRNFLRFFDHKDIAHCTVRDIRNFFHYLAHGHEEPGGRFGRAHMTKPLRPISIRDYYNSLRLLFEWLHAQGVTQQSLFAKISPPIARTSIKQPLSQEQLDKLMAAARQSSDPLRNCALIAFLLDTGCRAGETVGVKLGDIDLANGRCRVLGKGNKYRTVFFGQRTSEVLNEYLNASYERGGQSDASLPLFYSGLRLRIDLSQGIEVQPNDFETPDEGLTTVFRDPRGNLLEIPPAMTRSGMLHLMKRIAKNAGIKDDVCLHAFRRTFAIEMLRSGAHVFGVQALLGHTDLTQTRKYCAVALSDAEAQHRKYSPMDRLHPQIAG